MLIKEIIQRRDELRGYLHSLSIAQNYCERQIGDEVMINDLKKIYSELEVEFNKISDSLKPVEEMDM